METRSLAKLDRMLLVSGVQTTIDVSVVQRLHTEMQRRVPDRAARHSKIGHLAMKAGRSTAERHSKPHRALFAT